MPYDQVAGVDESPGDGGEQTPYRAKKTADQSVQFTLDPDFPVSKKRWWYSSNGTAFDATNISGSIGEIEVSTTATGTDKARLRTAISGEYVSHALAEPGQSVRIPPTHLSYDADGAVQLSHGRVIWGAFTYNGSNDAIENGLGLVLDSTGLSAFLRKNSSHVGNSPVTQTAWNIDDALDPGTGTGALDLSAGHTWNEPYTWYNANPLTVGYVDSRLDRFRPVHQFRPETSPTMGTPNLPIQFIVDNQGTASALEMYVGGVQYSAFGADRTARNVRRTVTGRTTGSLYIDTQVVMNNNTTDPFAEPGVPLLAVRRRGRETMPLNTDKFDVEPTEDVFLYVWDEYDAASALTGANFRRPHGDNTGDESQVEVDTEATAFTPTTATLREVIPVAGGAGTSAAAFTDERTGNAVPDRAARLVTAVHRGSACDVDPIHAQLTEGY
jgi:hypothetical protein